jgi:hypothetical protein
MTVGLGAGEPEQDERHAFKRRISPDDTTGTTDKKAGRGRLCRARLPERKKSANFADRTNDVLSSKNG